jgi:hypothetical protein
LFGSKFFAEAEYGGNGVNIQHANQNCENSSASKEWTRWTDEMVNQVADEMADEVANEMADEMADDMADEVADEQLSLAELQGEAKTGGCCNMAIK